MKALICYDTRNFSTMQICEGIRSGMNIETEILRVGEVSHLNYDIIVIGSPIFLGKPMQSVTDFIRINYDILKSKVLAAFIVCWAASTKYSFASEAFLKILTDELESCNLITSKIFCGKLILDELKERDKKSMLRIIDLLSKTANDFNKEDITWGDTRNFCDTNAFGKEIIEKAERLY